MWEARFKFCILRGLCHIQVKSIRLDKKLPNDKKY